MEGSFNDWKELPDGEVSFDLSFIGDDFPGRVPAIWYMRQARTIPVNLLPMDVSIKVASSPGDRLKAFMVRCVVFCGEQGVPYGIERDEFEDTAVHVLGEIDGEPVAAGRVRFLPDYAKLERIAVRAPWRGRGTGSEITRFLIRLAGERGYSSYRMSAQAHLEEFYGRLGFRAVGEVFLEADIEHVLMVREDRNPRSSDHGGTPSRSP